MPAGLLDRLLAAINPHIVGGTASWLGEPAASTGKAVHAAHLAILQRLATLCRDPAASDKVATLVRDKNNDPYLLTRLAELFQGRMTAAHSKLGDRFLQTLFGTHVADVARDVAGASGVREKSARALLDSASPHVLAVLGDHLRKAGALDAGALAALVHKEARAMAAQVPAGWDRLGMVAAAGATGAAASAAAASGAVKTANAARAPAAAPAPVSHHHGKAPAATAAGSIFPGWLKVAVPLVLLALLWPLWNWLRPSAPAQPSAPPVAAAATEKKVAVTAAPAPAKEAALPPAVRTAAALPTPAPVAKTPDVAPAVIKPPEIKPENAAPKPVADATPPKPAAPAAKAEPAVKSEPGVTTYFGREAKTIVVPAEAVINPEYAALLATAQPPAPAFKSEPGVTTYFGPDAKTVVVPAEAVINPEYAALLAPAQPPAPAFKNEPGVTTYFGPDAKTVVVPAEAVIDPEYAALLAPPQPAAQPAPSAATPEVAAAPAQTTTAHACQQEVSRAATSGPIHFRTGLADLTAESEATLLRLVAAIKACPAVRVHVEGHTDNVGSSRRNQKLSEERASAVAGFLANAGIPADRISPVGYGQTRPVAPNDSDDNRAKNRRIDFNIEDLKGS